MRRVSLVTLLVVSAWCVASPTFAQRASGAFFRIFLTDGTTLTSFGDFARVGDRVVFSLPMGELMGQPRLHLATVPADKVDWATTERYREATHAAQYAATRGEDDFAMLSGDIARLLSQIGAVPDPQTRLALAKEARARLAVWPAEHHGYRADENPANPRPRRRGDLRPAGGDGRIAIRPQPRGGSHHRTVGHAAAAPQSPGVHRPGAVGRPMGRSPRPSAAP